MNDGARLFCAVSGGLCCISPPLLAADRAAPVPTVNARASAGDGAFVPYSAPSRLRAGLAKLRVGYDGSSGRTEAQSEAAAPVNQRLSLRAGASYDSLMDAARPFFLAQLGILDQSDTGLGLALVGGAQAHGFNGDAEAQLGLSVSTRWHNTALLANVRYGQAFSSAERNVSLSVATLRELVPGLDVGFDSQLDCDLERDADEPINEPDWRARGGPLLSVTYSTFALTLGGGMTATRYRLAPPAAWGALAHLGLGAVF
jgi:hypothetical protein